MVTHSRKKNLFTVTQALLNNDELRDHVFDALGLVLDTFIIGLLESSKLSLNKSLASLTNESFNEKDAKREAKNRITNGVAPMINKLNTLLESVPDTMFKESMPNDNEERDITVSLFVTSALKQYQAWWREYRLLHGDIWKGQKERLFIQEDGKPLFPDTVNFWLTRFAERNGLDHINPHALRHTFITLQIAAGVDIRTLQARTGHSQASTLLNVYTHAIKSAQEKAAQAMDDMLLAKAFLNKS